MVSFCFLLLPGLNFFDIFRTQKLFFGINNEMDFLFLTLKKEFNAKVLQTKGLYANENIGVYFDSIEFQQ